MAELTDLDGVGPARSDSLVDAGYEDVASLAEADPDVLAEDADLPEDRALDFVVQAQNIIDSEESSEEPSEDADDVSSDDGPLPGELAEVSEEAEEDEETVVGGDTADASAEVEEEEEPTYALTVDLEDDIHYDCYMTALLNAYERRHGSNQQALDAIIEVLDDARYNSGTVEHDVTAFELNTLHSAVSQQVNDYKGQNMIPHMDAMRDVLAQVNDVRNAELF